MANATEDTVLYLDALDEVMIPVKTAGPILARWVRDSLPEKKPKLRISCRSAIWPQDLGEAIKEVYGENDGEKHYAVAQLQQLSSSDVQCIAAEQGLDSKAFTAAIEAAKALVLSQQPLTLEMLLRTYNDQGTLPTSRADLFAARRAASRRGST